MPDPCTSASWETRRNLLSTGTAKPHRRPSFSEAACLFLRGNEQAQHYHSRLVSKHGKGKALSILAHKIGRAVYFMLRRKEPFNMETFFARA
jgi:hypothetical protein